MGYKIYCLIDPFTLEVKYVGKTSLGLESRLLQHLVEKQNEGKRQWIEALSNKGAAPLIKILEETSSKLSTEREQYWVAYYHNVGYGLYNNKLLNKLKTFEELEWLKKHKGYVFVNKIEKAIGLPATTLDKALKGRGLPSHWHEPLKKWVINFLAD